MCLRRSRLRNRDQRDPISGKQDGADQLRSLEYVKRVPQGKASLRFSRKNVAHSQTKRVILFLAKTKAKVPRIEHEASTFASENDLGI